MHDRIPTLPVESDWSDMGKARKQMAELLEMSIGQQPEPEGVRYEDRAIPGPPGA